jgi:hypothetical protein
VSTFGAPSEAGQSDRPPRWMALLAIAAAVHGVVLGLCVFAALT